MALALPALLAFPPGAARAAGFTDVPDGHWAGGAISVVAGSNDWMRDYGTSTFKPGAVETRKLFARAVVRAFARSEPTDPSIKFTDLPTTDPFYPFANVAVKKGWIKALPDGRFLPGSAVHPILVHRALVLALGLHAETAGLAAISTKDGHKFSHRDGFATLVLGLELGLRYNHPDEAADVLPLSRLSRAEVAWSLYKADYVKRSAPWRLTALAPYRTIKLPSVTLAKRNLIQFGLDYTGYPYVYAGEWNVKTPTGYCCGAQPIGGFDCSGLVWWVMKSAEGGYDATKVRPYAGWSLPQRASFQMAAVGEHLPYERLLPGDLMFYDGNDDGTIDHVNIYAGNNWALDSSSGRGGVSIMHLPADGWYRDHFKWGRRIIPAPSGKGSRDTIPVPPPGTILEPGPADDPLGAE